MLFENLVSIKVKVFKDWQDLDWQFKKDEEIEVYDTPQDNAFYFICFWGHRVIPKGYCQVIKSVSDKDKREG